MFTACFDSRADLPWSVKYFLGYTSKRIPLHFLASPKLSQRQLKTKHIQFGSSLKTIKSSDILFFHEIEQLFDRVYVNLSTNPLHFERACFVRWLALNSASYDLADDEFICLLDTDFLIGATPDEILTLCLQESKNSNLDFIAQWNPENLHSISPSITILRKKALHHFCKFLLTEYFSPLNNLEHCKVFYDTASKGIAGGICDMRALAKWRDNFTVNCFNLTDLKSHQTIGNLNTLVQQLSRSADEWEIQFNKTSQFLVTPTQKIPLIGTHFQGSAKDYLDSIINIGPDLDVLRSNQTYLAYNKLSMFHLRKYYIKFKRWA